MIPTFDIWLEDSTGRQFRRSNRYGERFAINVLGIWIRYRLMANRLKDAGLHVSTRTKQFTS